MTKESLLKALEDARDSRTDEYCLDWKEMANQAIALVKEHLKEENVKFEYRHTIIPAHVNDAGFLNKFGADGWEMCGVQDNGECYLKRRISTTPAKPGESEGV